MKKIVMIGPVYPYRGGISHYTGMMCNSLRKKYHVTMISFSLQYPKLLFHKEQKDFANDSFRVEDTKFWINTTNPLNWVNCARKIMAENPDLVIIQWWHPYFAPCYRIMVQGLKRLKILFICHNVFPHERFPMDRELTRAVLKQANGFIVQSKSDELDLLKIIKNPLHEQTVHPTYNAFKLENISSQRARKLLNLNEKDKVLLFFGFIREYKGLKYLIKAMPEITKKLDHIKLLIVGEFGSTEEKEKHYEMIRTAGIEQNVLIYDGYIPDREVEKFFAACNLVVLPYESATQSGIVQIAYGFDKPVVVTDVGGLPDVVRNNETGYIVKSKDIEQLAEAVIRFFTDKREVVFSKNVREEAYRFSWDRMVETIEELEKKM